jgi:peroxiredoxin
MITPVRLVVPDLHVDTVAHGRWRLAETRGLHATLIVFYRGLHSPLCRAGLAELSSLRGEFARHGVDAIAVSCDDAARAARTVDEWKLRPLRVGCGLSAQTARKWGVHVRTGGGATLTAVDSPAVFTEPAVFLVRPDLTLHFASVQTAPLVRLHFIDLLAAVAAGGSERRSAFSAAAAPIRAPARVLDELACATAA